MRAHETAALAVFRKEFGDQVRYFGAGLDGGSVTAIRSDVPGDPFEGFGGRARKVAFEITALALPGEPSKQDRIVEANTDEWRVTDIALLGDVRSWSLVVERA